MLDTAGLKTDILNLLTTMRTKTKVSDEEFASTLASSIEKFVKTGEVQAGIPVSTTGSATAQTGATTSTGKIL